MIKIMLRLVAMVMLMRLGTRMLMLVAGGKREDEGFLPVMKSIVSRCRVLKTLQCCGCRSGWPFT